MDKILRLPQADFRLACIQVEDRMRLAAASVEKDFWVCWTLRELFALPGIGGHITFKGGTSLSKAWGIIRRFSEDIDLVVDKAALGFTGDASPERAPSKMQRAARVEALMGACRQWVQGPLAEALSARIKGALGADGWTLEVDPDVADGQCLLFHYPAAFRSGEMGYVRPVVKIELGARSDDWPHSQRVILSYIAEAFPQLDGEAAFSVSVLDAERTFWEKAMLLHEEGFRHIDKRTKTRMARHYYDLWCLIGAGVAKRALADQALFDRVAAHRAVFFRHSFVDYSTLSRGQLRILPPDHRLAFWRKDYLDMAGPMFFGEVPSFDEILDVIGRFESEFNATDRDVLPS